MIDSEHLVSGEALDDDASAVTCLDVGWAIDVLHPLAR